jgi:hypothetical protein
MRVFRNRVMRKIFGPTWQEVTGDYKIRSLIKVFLVKYHSGDKITNEMGEACCTYGGTGRVHTGFWWGELRERVYLENPGIDRSY